jgi:hypothetical protein
MVYWRHNIYSKKIKLLSKELFCTMKTKNLVVERKYALHFRFDGDTEWNTTASHVKFGRR